MDKLGKYQIDPYLKGYALYNQEVSLFEFGEVIVVKNYKECDGVRLVSGGSSNHIEYVGEGMLTAAVQGKRTDPPTPNLILRTLRELSVNHVKGILVIVQASSTDVLNFGLATERAENDDLRVAFLGVSDDCRNGQYPKGAKKGLSGVVLVNKIAGALTRTDKTIVDIFDYCSKVIDNLISIGTNMKKLLVTTRECLYCKKCAFGADGSEVKKTILKKLSIIDIIKDTVDNLLSEINTNRKFSLTSGESIVVLINNLGALNESEQYIFFTHCMTFLNSLQVKVVKFYIGSYLGLNYDMDLTLTMLKVFDNNILNLLDAPCKATGWKPIFQYGIIGVKDNIMPGGLRRKCRLSPPVKGPKLKDKFSNIVQLCLQFACDALISCEKMLNKMDAEKGDGDTGTRIRIVAEVLNKRSCNKKLNTLYPFTFFLTLSKLLESTVGGKMGCIYSIFFEAAAHTFGEFPEEEDISAEMWLQALENACAAVKKYGNVEIGDKTMYDPLVACSTSFRQNFAQGRYLYSFGVGVAKAEEVAQVARRPGCKYPDAGAHAVGIWMRAVYEAVKLKCFD